MAGLVGAIIIGLVHYLVLPALAQRLTANQVAWLRETFKTHTLWVLFTILGVSALLGLPVLLVALWAAGIGPWREKENRVSHE
ncbi:MAG: hypothetical protein WA637_09490 [Terriglobales bacterium]